MDTLTNTVDDEVPQVGEVPQVVPNRADWRKRGHRNGRYRMPRTAARRTGQSTAWRTVEVDDEARRERKRLVVAFKRHGAEIDDLDLARRARKRLEQLRALVADGGQ